MHQPRRLDYHPHVHMVFPAAALNQEKRLWRTKRCKGKSRYLFNHKALAKVFRAKLFEAMTPGWSRFTQHLSRALGGGLQSRWFRRKGTGLSGPLSLSRSDSGKRHRGL